MSLEFANGVEGMDLETAESSSYDTFVEGVDGAFFWARYSKGCLSGHSVSRAIARELCDFAVSSGGYWPEGCDGEMAAAISLWAHECDYWGRYLE